MSMSTILESGTMVYVGHLTASRDADGKTRDAKVCIQIGTVFTGDFGLHLHPAEAIRLADCLIQMAKSAARSGDDLIPQQEAA
ncbi:hypothetical protein [Malikia spinosa]|uniref:hypothetical protein n=1 Tax=Malikia spinosa TaxID=86180 RepID=UPI002FDA305D